VRSKIAIVGAGPAGASLAIRLALQNFEVRLIEREKFPRHKLCGEFISPECLKHFEDLGVLGDILLAGGEQITETRFYEQGGRNVAVPSKWFGGGFALSLSRAEMDMRLLNRARAVGVEVLDGTAVTGIHSLGSSVCSIAVTGSGKSIAIKADLFIDATGRARALARLVERSEYPQNAKAASRKSVLVGFKAHLRGARPAKGRCEIYSFRGGYGGLCGIENGWANHCFLVKPEVAREFGGNADRIVENVVLKNQRAAETLEYAEPVGGWLAVSIDHFGRSDLNPAPNLFSVGDSAAFIDPFTGSGMLMALESSGVLAKCIRECEFSPEKLSQRYERTYWSNFAGRLRICSILRTAALAPHLAKFVISILRISKSGRETLAQSTRQKIGRLRKNS